MKYNGSYSRHKYVLNMLENKFSRSLKTVVGLLNREVIITGAFSVSGKANVMRLAGKLIRGSLCPKYR